MSSQASSISIEKLHGASNFHTWKFAMLNVLESLNLEEAIQVTEAGAVKETKADKLRKAKNMIVLNIDSALYTHVSKYSSAHEIWVALERLYDDKGLGRKIGLLRNLISIRLESSGDMQTYIDGIVDVSNKLQGIGFDLTDDWLTSIVLAGLTEDYRPLIMGLEASGKDLSSDEVISKLIDNATETSGKETAFAATPHGKKNKPKKSWKRKCFNCGTEHLKKNCDQKSGKGNKNEAFLSVLSDEYALSVSRGSLCNQ